jgi:hypothetical protein
LNRFNLYSYYQIESVQLAYSHQEVRMIPASYLFKQVYHQHWEAAEPAIAPKADEPGGGMTIPLRQVITLAARAALDKLWHRRHEQSAHDAG